MAHDHDHHDGSHQAHGFNSDALGHGHAHHHGHSQSAHAHGSTDKTRVLIAALLTGAFMVAEAVGGLVTGSLALLADAGHMLTDSISLLLAWYAFHLGARAATDRLTYGFDRVKTLVAYTNGLTVFAIGLFILYEAVQRVAEPVQIMGAPMLAIAVLGLLVNIAAFFVLHGGDRGNLNMRGAILHVLGDLLGSVAAIIAALVIMATGWWPIDPILSVLVAVLLFRSAWALIRESGHVLLEGVPDTLDRATITRDLQTSIEGVREVHHVHVWSMDGSRNIATLHACLTEEADASTVVRAVKQRLAEHYQITHVTVETERDHCADAAVHAH